MWKTEERPADNKNAAESAVRSPIKRLQSLGEFENYEKILMGEYLELGAIELEPCPQEPGFYMPHHAVIRKEAITTKRRIVFNASAKGNVECGKSLNDLIDPGPSLLPDMIGLFLRFREFKVALQADIRKAFCMISVKPEDRAYLRFLWPGRKGGELQTCRLASIALHSY